MFSVVVVVAVVTVGIFRSFGWGSAYGIRENSSCGIASESVMEEAGGIMIRLIQVEESSVQIYDS